MHNYVQLANVSRFVGHFCSCGQDTHTFLVPTTIGTMYHGAIYHEATYDWGQELGIRRSGLRNGYFLWKLGRTRYNKSKTACDLHTHSIFSTSVCHRMPQVVFISPLWLPKYLIPLGNMSFPFTCLIIANSTAPTWQTAETYSPMTTTR